MRLLVHEPMNTRSTGTSDIGVPGTRPMYSSETRIASRLVASGAADGSGTRSVISIASSGLVPQVSIGAIRVASRATSRSKTASASVGSARQRASARSQSAPAGASGRPCR